MARSPYDPVVWTLWAEVQERAGDWAEAVRGRQCVRRLKQTTLPKHREQLKLVLAGKQIKDAAAGIKEAATAAATLTTGAGYSSSSYQYYGNRWSEGADSETTHLAALYVKLGRFEQAERLYLLMGGRNVAQSVLPELSALMWRQGAKERALELLRLAVVMSEGTDFIPRFAGLLAAAGHVDDATSLLIRAYRCLKTREAGSPYSMMWGGYGAGNREEFEDHQEHALASALHDVLSSSGTRAATLAELSQQAAREPNDTRLAKLILSLQIRARRWNEARESLAARRAARPYDVAVMMEQLRVNLQLRDWAAALQILDGLRRESPESSNRLRIHEAFARLMQGDCAGAVAAVEPLLDSGTPESPDVQPAQVWTVLAVARDYERLRGYLQTLLERDALDETGQDLLLRTYLIERDWQSAVRLAQDRFWDEPRALTGKSSAYRALVTAVRHSQREDQAAVPSSARPEDDTLLTLITDGPATGARAFQALLAEDPENLNARRGLVLAATLADDYALAASANLDLIAWLQPRRLQVWRPATQPSVGARADQFLAGMESAGLDSPSILGMTMSFAGLLQQTLQTSQAQEHAAVKYDELWRAHHLLQPKLLLYADRTEELAALLQTQASYAAAAEQNRSRQRNRRYYSSPFGYVDYESYGWRGDRDEEFARDWRAALRAALSAGQRLRALADNLEGLGSRVPRDYWRMLSEAYAAAGQDEYSRRWKHKAVDALLADLRAGEGPRITSEEDRYSWRWYGQMASQYVQGLRGKLNVQLPRAEQTADDGPRSPLSGKLDELWEFALLEPEVESRLTELAQSVGPGWGGTQTVQQLVAYHRAKKQPARIIALLERILESDQLLRSEHLSEYLRACYEVQDWARLEKVLTAALELSSTLKNDVDLARLVMLRHQGQDAEADVLEQQLIDGCRVEAANPYRLDQRLLGRPSEQVPQSFTQYYGWSPWQRRQVYSRLFPGGFTEDLADVTSLARALGVRYEGAVTPEDLDLRRIRAAYANHGFHEHAARIVAIELARLPAGATEREHLQLLGRKASYLALAGDDQAARELAEQVEAFWVRQAQTRPTDALPHERLAALYASKAFGRDHAKAYEALLTAKRLDPAIDRSGVDEAGYLYELGRHAEAWQRYQSALNRGETGDDPGTLYRAGIAARKSGHAGVATGLVRRALWCDPRHKLADEARELIDE